MWPASAFSISEGYGVAILTLAGTALCGVVAYLFRTLARGDRRLTVLEGHDEEHTKDAADHENRIRDLERRR